MTELYQCRICLEDSHHRKDFIVPCLCMGTSKYVHRRCLDEWRSQNPDSDNFFRCNTCHYRYEIIDVIQDPKLEANRRKLYNKAIALDIGRMIFGTIMIIMVIMCMLYCLNMCNIINIRSYMYQYFWISSKFLAYMFAAIIILLIALAIPGFIMTMRGYRIHNHFYDENENYMYAVSRAYDKVNLITLFFAGIIIGIVTGIHNVYMYIDSKKRHHRQRIWLKKEAVIKIVKDYGDNGPRRI